MIDIQYERSDEGHALSITGHAGYAAHGEDIVCAGVSAITYALVGYIDSYGEDILTNYIMADGHVEIACGNDTSIDTAFAMACIGYSLIAREYTQFVSFTNMSL